MERNCPEISWYGTEFQVWSLNFAHALSIIVKMSQQILVTIVGQISTTYQHNGGRQKQIQVCKCRFHVYSESEVDNLGSHPLKYYAEKLD